MLLTNVTVIRANSENSSKYSNQQHDSLRCLKVY